ncbi:hypothetical protein PO124_18940 [Bacillus licheniformis]|nr:hypothetical protein [Bacillus licheniformis]
MVKVWNDRGSCILPAAVGETSFRAWPSARDCGRMQKGSIISSMR